MIIDSHAHLTSSYYGKELPEIVERSNSLIVNIVGYDYESSLEALGLAKEKKNFFASAGFHPYDINKLNEGVLLSLEELLKEEKIIALGEIGLDYYREITDFSLQRSGFEKQILLAKKLGKPIIIHSRNSFEDVLSIVKNHMYFKGIFHSFDYTITELKKVLDLGFLVSFSGMVTFSRREGLRDALKYVPIDRLLFETDSPFLTTEPFRGKRNEPIYVKYLYEFYSELVHIDLTSLEEKLLDNFLVLFKLKTFFEKEAKCSKF